MSFIYLQTLRLTTVFSSLDRRFGYFLAQSSKKLQMVVGLRIGLQEMDTAPESWSESSHRPGDLTTDLMLWGTSSLLVFKH